MAKTALPVRGLDGYRRILTPALLAVMATACSSSDDEQSVRGSGGAGGAGTGGVGAQAGGSGAGQGGAGQSGAGQSGAGQSGVGGGAGATGGTAGVGGGGGSAGGERSPEAVCGRWKADRADMNEGTWSGNVAACNPGDISAVGRANALRLYNLYRWLADLPPVTTDQERDTLAQACALLMEANGSLSHDPPSSWTCFTDPGAEGAGSSNISGSPGVRSVDAYMIDPGNATTIGHRRWILSNSLGPIGLGSTATGASCMQNLRGQGRANKPWTAWPPPGNFPLQAVMPQPRRPSLDETGWTIQSDNIELAAAVVSVSSGSATLPVILTQLRGGYGSRHALRFDPDGWQTQAGNTYSVRVTGIATAISYDVAVIDCGS